MPGERAAQPGVEARSRRRARPPVARPHLVGRLRGARLGLPARRPSACSPRWPRSGCRATELGPVGWLPPTRPRCAPRSSATGCSSSAASSRSCCTTADCDAARAERRAAWPRAGGRGRGRLRAAVVIDDDWSRAACRSTTRAAPGSPSSSRSSSELVAGHGLELVLHPHAGTLVETRRDVERMLAPRRRRGASTPGTSRSAAPTPPTSSATTRERDRARPPEGRRRRASPPRCAPAS